MATLQADSLAVNRTTGHGATAILAPLSFPYSNWLMRLSVWARNCHSKSIRLESHDSSNFGAITRMSRSLSDHASPRAYEPERIARRASMPEPRMADRELCAALSVAARRGKDIATPFNVGSSSPRAMLNSIQSSGALAWLHRRASGVFPSAQTLFGCGHIPQYGPCALPT